MTTKKNESETLKRVLLMLNRRYMQVCCEDIDDPQKQTAEQIHAYTIAMEVISNIEEEIQHYLITGEDKECPIRFDEEGNMFI